jgi:hypothetical protein
MKPINLSSLKTLSQFSHGGQCIIPKLRRQVSKSEGPRKSAKDSVAQTERLITCCNDSAAQNVLSEMEEFLGSIRKALNDDSRNVNYRGPHDKTVLVEKKKILWTMQLLRSQYCRILTTRPYAVHQISF